MICIDFFFLQKPVVPPNPFKMKMKNSPIIEKLQVATTDTTDVESENERVLFLFPSSPLSKSNESINYGAAPLCI